MKKSVPANLTKRDLTRAPQVVLGQTFQVAHSSESNAMLNRHLTRLADGQTKPCEDFSLGHLEDLHHKLMAKKHPEIYASNRHPWKGDTWRDPRGSDSVELHAAALAQLGEEDARIAKSEKLL